MRSVQHFINGEFAVSASGQTFDKRSPLDNAVIAHIAEGGAAEVDAAVAAARAALHGDWARLGSDKRLALLHAVADEMTRRFDDFVAAEKADTGQPHHVIAHAFVPRGAANFKIFADVVRNVPTEAFQTETPDGRGALNYAIRKPKGVIGVICPWNAPLLLMTWKVGPALACGNTVVVKPSEETPLSAALLGEVMNAVGVPKGVYNVVHGFGPDSAGEALLQQRGVGVETREAVAQPPAGVHLVFHVGQDGEHVALLAERHAQQRTYAFGQTQVGVGVEQHQHGNGRCTRHALSRGSASGAARRRRTSGCPAVAAHSRARCRGRAAGDARR